MYMYRCSAHVTDYVTTLMQSSSYLFPPFFNPFFSKFSKNFQFYNDKLTLFCNMSFGGPIRPLPGQPGYGMRESDKLAQETREMQINLMKIQEQMKRVKTKGDQAVEEGGAGRWRSARSDRGSLRRYNKDIKSGTVRRNTSKRGGPREMVRAISQSPN